MRGASKKQQNQSDPSNPFFCPTDNNELIRFEMRKRREEEEKAKNEASHLEKQVWERHTFRSKNMLVAKVPTESIPMQKLTDRQYRLVEAKQRENEQKAKALLNGDELAPMKRLPQNDELGDGRTVRDYVDKKRELFLTELDLDVKRAEILKLDDKARRKEEALKHSQRMLDEDTTRFETFLQQNDQNAHRKLQQQELLVKKKQEKQIQIRNLYAQIAKAESDINRYKETNDEQKSYEDFLNRLTPDEWRVAQAKKKADEKEALCKEWCQQKVEQVSKKIHAQIADLENEHKEKILGVRNTHRHPRTRRKLNIMDENDLVEFLDKELADKKQELKDSIPSWEKFRDEYVAPETDEEAIEEIYFTKPSHLMEIFHHLEEQNLFLIQTLQETEQTFDELKATMTKQRAGSKTKAETLTASIKKLENSIREEKSKLAVLYKRLKQKTDTEEADKQLHKLEKIVENIYLQAGFNDDHDPDTLGMLAEIEAKFEGLVNRMDELVAADDEPLIMHLEHKAERERRERVRVQRLAEQKAHQEARLQAALLRSQAPIYQKVGKTIMKRSAPLHSGAKVVENDEELEQQLEDLATLGLVTDAESGSILPKLSEHCQEKLDKKLNGNGK